jgi:hypothetical protein
VVDGVSTIVQTKMAVRLRNLRPTALRKKGALFALSVVQVSVMNIQKRFAKFCKKRRTAVTLAIKGFNAR